jgi:hypothetical protein
LYENVVTVIFEHVICYFSWFQVHCDFLIYSAFMKTESRLAVWIKQDRLQQLQGSLLLDCSGYKDELRIHHSIVCMVYFYLFFSSFLVNTGKIL